MSLHDDQSQSIMVNHGSTSTTMMYLLHRRNSIIAFPFFLSFRSSIKGKLDLINVEGSFDREFRNAYKLISLQAKLFFVETMFTSFEAGKRVNECYHTPAINQRISLNADKRIDAECWLSHPLNKR